MKKLLFTLLLAAAVMPGWAEELYLVGRATPIGWKSSGRAITKMNEKETNLFEWKGLLEANTSNDDGFKVCNGDNSWNGYKAIAKGQDIASGTPYTMTTDGDNKWDITETGFYTVTVDLRNGAKTLTVVKESSVSFGINRSSESPYSINYCEIGSLQALKDFGNLVNTGTNSTSMNAKLTADITDAMDFAIGWYDSGTSNKLYSGEFNGDGHTVTLGINDESNSKKGLFGAAKGGAYIHDLIVAGSVTAQAKAAGIIGYADGGGTITLTNVINTADIDSKGNSDANAAGLVGCAVNNTVINATNCANTGNVKNSGYNGGTQQCAAFAGWTQSGTAFTNCYNIGDIYNMDNNQSLYRKPGDATVTVSNCYDANGSDFYTQGTKIERATVASGELCYKLNDNTSGGTDWYQTLTSDAFPFPFSTHRKVYQYASSWFSNLVITGSPLTTTISSANDLMEFSRIVNNGNSVNAELTTDIDMDGITDYTPIGVDAHRFSSTFDGKGFRIKNLKIETDTKEQGLFSVCAGGATIKNLIIDSSCSITCNNSSNHGAAAFVAVCNGSGTLTFENCGNEADVYGAKSNNGAFLGFNHSNGNVSISLTNCYNTGKISGGYDNCAIIGWNGDNTFTMTNCYNIGTVENYNGDKNTWARSGGTKNVNNCYSKNVTGTDYDFDDNLTMINDAQKTSGELCYNLGSVFRQALGAGGDAYPVLDSSKPNVYKMTVGSAGWASFVPEVNIATLPTDVTAYVGQNNGNSLHLEAVTALPADNAFIVKATGGDYYYNNTNESVTLSEENDLDFYAADHTADGSQYCLSNKASGVGFYKVGVDVTIPARKAYLTITTTGAKEFYGFDDDDATGISLMEDGRSQMEDGAIYNLAGQRINKMQRGINIVNGKKVLK